ncbi:PREDICTED: pentatricopeptide repeat-containing protein At1g73710 [Tarenaya hassleriana]|uniref:pentatricopeptide repeat-containing protein At1g73710 n=1 Tax=Tarenaya hassleriana TaxID=28532 RepID=UPI00053C4D5D|nr:PREDICTED: pentatricopeptide repeat-containing protein At1g73710 [Tarenaya hassleriana]
MLLQTTHSSRDVGHERLGLHMGKHLSPPCAPTTRVFVGFSLPSFPRNRSLGFNLRCASGSAVFPARGSKLRPRKRGYGGVLPSILRSLESASDIETTLSSSCLNLSPKEQTVVLKEQSCCCDRILRVFRFFKSQDTYVPNVIHYNIVLRALGRAGKWDELRLCWIEMAHNGVLPTNNTYAMLVDVYGKAGLVNEALLWVKHMAQRGHFPDEVTMTTVVRVLKDAHEFERAHTFFKDWCAGRLNLDALFFGSVSNCSVSSPVNLKQFLSMELFRIGARSPIEKSLHFSTPSDSSPRKPRLTSTYNTLIDLYGKAGRLEDAANAFSEMLKSGVPMDTITFNTMIHTCGTHGYLSEAESLMGKMEEKGVSPDTKTYNILLSLHADAGDIDAALKYYWKIREVGLFPDTVTHRAVIHMLCQRNMVGEVEAVMAEMDRHDIRIDEHSVPVVMQMYVKEGFLERAKSLFERFQLDCVLSSVTLAAIIDVYAEKGLWEEAEAVFFGKRNVAGQRNDVLECNVMIKAYGKAGLHDKALSLVKGMKNQGNWPDECTYNSLMQMLAGVDLVDESHRLLAEMLEAGYKPRCKTLSALIASYVRLNRLSEAVDLYESMHRMGVKPNEVVYGSLINGFAENGRVEEALQYFHMMEEHGIQSNQIVLTSLIKAYSKVGSLEEARRVYEKMKDSQGGPDTAASNSMLSLCADLGMVSEAETIFNDLRVKGTCDVISFATMMYLYKTMGMLDKAIEVAEEMKQSSLLRDCTSFNQVMSCYAAYGQLRECCELLHEMIAERKLSPDWRTFKTMFTLLKKGGIPNEAVAQLEFAYNEAKPHSAQAITATLFSVVGLHAFALELCQAFLSSGTPLEHFTYNAAIYTYGSSKDVDKALNVYMRMQDEGLEPDVVTQIYLVGVYGKAGMVEGVKRMHSWLTYGELETNESLFKAVRDAYVSVNRQDLADQVKKEMSFAFEPEEECSMDSGLEDEASDYGSEEGEEDESIW